MHDFGKKELREKAIAIIVRLPQEMQEARKQEAKEAKKKTEG